MLDIPVMRYFLFCLTIRLGACASAPPPFNTMAHEYCSQERGYDRGTAIYDRCVVRKERELRFEYFKG